MRQALSKFGLLGLCLLLSIFIIKSVNAADDYAADIDLSTTVFHTSRLHTLNIGSGGIANTGALRVTGAKLWFTNGLIVGDNQNVNGDAGSHSVIGGGRQNTVSAEYAGIGGGQINIASSKYSVVAGGYKNVAGGKNAVVVGGNNNQANGENSVVVGGSNNHAEGKNAVAIGGNSNIAHPKSLALGDNSESYEGSFAWNAKPTAGYGLINATSGILVGTTTPIDLVNLVVNGPVKIAGTNDNTNKYKGEIRYVGGCFYAFDGKHWYVINRGEENVKNVDCHATFPIADVAKYCEFGNTVVWNGDTVVAYSQPYGTGNNCVNKYQATITCNNGVFSSSTHVYPYCYTIHN